MAERERPSRPAHRWLRPWPDGVLLVLAGLLALASTGPWYQLRTSPEPSGVAASAWSSSPGWATGVSLCLLAMAMWVLLRWRAARGAAFPRWLRWLPLATAVVGLVVTVWSWRAIPSVGSGSFQGPMAWQLQDARPSTAGERGALELRDRESNVAWGFFAGQALMTLFVVVVTAATRGAFRRRSAGDAT